MEDFSSFDDTVEDDIEILEEMEPVTEFIEENEAEIEEPPEKPKRGRKKKESTVSEE